jgi:Uma2 family endonuclease
MIVRPHAPLLTVAEYKNLPETGPRYQLIEGDLYMAPAPNRFHQDISRNLPGALDRYLETNPIGILWKSARSLFTDLSRTQPTRSMFGPRPTSLPLLCCLDFRYESLPFSGDLDRI